VISGRFEIEALAGTGGMGAVYRARDRLSAGPVAIKVLAGVGSRDGHRFDQEARLLAELNHPRIVRYVSHGDAPDGQRFLAMEWLEGDSLAARLARGPLTVDDTLSMAGGIASALASAHAHGVVHRDIKPGNLFLVGGDVSNVKVLDFGLARVHGAGQAMSRTGVLMGTPGYVAPEQARGARDLGPPVDVFALGCVLFECLTGRAAFVGEHVLALLAKILLDESPRVSDLFADVPQGVDHLIARMMAKDPGERPGDGSEVARLVTALQTAPDQAPLTPSGRFRPRVLTRDERRLVSVVVAGRATPRGADPHGTADTITISDDSESMWHLQHGIESLGVRVERLADGSLVAAIEGQGNAADQAAQAARVALKMRAELPSLNMVLATGRGMLAGRLPVGDVIDGAVRLLRADTGAEGVTSEPPPIRVDPVTAGLLDAAFLVEVDERGLVLRGERPDGEVVRTLLGRPSPCVGRERELSVLEGLWHECLAEPLARAVLVTAPAGVGKTRLRSEFLRRQRDRGEGVDAWLARGDALGASGSFGILAQLARRALGLGAPGYEPIELERERLRAAVGALLDEADAARVTPFLAELTSVPWPEDESAQVRSARKNPLALGEQLRSAWAALLAAVLRQGPVLIVVEDAHWGDLATMKILDGALRDHAEDPLMIMALARPEVHERFPRLWVERAVQELRIGELTRRASERLVRQALGERATAEVVERLIAQAGGHAFFLEELVRAEAEAGAGAEIYGRSRRGGTVVVGASTVDGDGPGRAVDPLGTVLAVLQSRLEALPAEHRRLLRAASILGPQFGVDGLMVLLGPELGHATIAGWVDALTEREILVRLGGDGEATWGFRHALVRDAARAMLTEADRSIGHRLVAEWLERQGGADPVLVGEHFDRGGEPGRAAPWHVRAAAQALAGNDLAGVLERTERAILCGAGETLLGRAQLLRAEAHYWRGEYAAAGAAATAASRLFPPGAGGWHQAIGAQAAAFGNVGDGDALTRLAAVLLATPLGGDSEVAALRTIAIARVAMYCVFGGHVAEVERLLSVLTASETAAAERDAAARGWVEAAWGVRTLGGDSGAAWDHLQASIAAFDQAGDARNAVMQRINGAFAAIELGAYADAEATLRAALGPAERMGLRNATALARNNLGLALCRLGRYDEGAAQERIAIAQFEEQNDQRLVAASQAYLALTRLGAGALGEAAQAAEAAVAAAGPYPPARAYYLAVLAEVRLAEGDAVAALRAARAGRSLLAELGGIDEGEAYLRLQLGRALVAAGERAEARTVLSEAAARLAVRARGIADPAKRRGFLESVPENAATVALLGELE
jgi:serine/threonine protein kinase/tetratricopeptide (TPR) repeat protein